MADLLSLKRARKARKRAEKQQLAAENRTRYGRPKAETTKNAAEKALAEKTIDAHKRDVTE